VIGTKIPSNLLKCPIENDVLQHCDAKDELSPSEKYDNIAHTELEHLQEKNPEKVTIPPSRRNNKAIQIICTSHIKDIVV
jgi:hypothetical protein